VWFRLEANISLSRQGEYEIQQETAQVHSTKVRESNECLSQERAEEDSTGNRKQGQSDARVSNISGCRVIMYPKSSLGSLFCLFEFSSGSQRVTHTSIRYFGGLPCHKSSGVRHPEVGSLQAPCLWPSLDEGMRMFVRGEVSRRLNNRGRASDETAAEKHC
jgi:hypothetical protein